MKIKIDPQFSTLIPACPDAEMAELERTILADGWTHIEVQQKNPLRILDIDRYVDPRFAFFTIMGDDGVVGLKRPVAISAWRSVLRVLKFDGKGLSIKSSSNFHPRETNLRIERTPRRKRIGPIAGFVYFIQCGDSGPIKIGFSVDPAGRLRALRIHAPYPLRLLAKIPGNVPKEHRIHEIFSGLRLQGEWFTPAKSLLEFIRREAS